LEKSNLFIHSRRFSSSWVRSPGGDYRGEITGGEITGWEFT